MSFDEEIKLITIKEKTFQLLKHSLCLSPSLCLSVCFSLSLSEESHAYCMKKAHSSYNKCKWHTLPLSHN